MCWINHQWSFRQLLTQSLLFGLVKFVYVDTWLNHDHRNKKSKTRVMTTHPALQILLEEHWRSCCCPKYSPERPATNTERKPDQNSNSKSQNWTKWNKMEVHTPTVILAACCSFPPLFPLRDAKLMPVAGPCGSESRVKQHGINSEHFRSLPSK